MRLGSLSCVCEKSTYLTAPRRTTPHAPHQKHTHIKFSLAAYSNESCGPPPTSHPSTWPLSTVLEWLRSIPVLRTTQTVSLCVSNRITGKDLLTINSEQLCEVMGVVFGPHKRVLNKELLKLRNMKNIREVGSGNGGNAGRSKSISPTERVARVRKNDRDKSLKYIDDVDSYDNNQSEEELSIASGLNDDDSAIVTNNNRNGRAKVFSRGAARHLAPSMAPPPLLNLGGGNETGERVN